MLTNQRRFIGLTVVGFLAVAPFATANIDSVVAQPISSTIFRSTALSKHNAYRSIHRSPAMSVSNTANNTSQAWANQLATTGTFAHSSSSQRNGAGENLYVYYTTAASIAPDTLAKSALDAWYNEVKLYNYAVPNFSAATGHFTQVVWKGSTQLGCGASKGVKTLSGRQYTAFYVVCHYSPAGNVSGRFASNVLKP